VSVAARSVTVVVTKVMRVAAKVIAATTEVIVIAPIRLPWSGTVAD